MELPYPPLLLMCGQLVLLGAEVHEQRDQKSSFCLRENLDLQCSVSPARVGHKEIFPGLAAVLSLSGTL